jgi:hypothetical protein
MRGVRSFHDADAVRRIVQAGLAPAAADPDEVLNPVSSCPPRPGPGRSVWPAPNDPSSWLAAAAILAAAVGRWEHRPCQAAVDRRFNQRR